MAEGGRAGETRLHRPLNLGPVFHGAQGRARSRTAQRLVPQTPDEVLDLLAELAAHALRSPMAQLSMLGETQTVVAGYGLVPGAVGSTGPLEDSLCTVTVGSGVPLLVEDASADERVAFLVPVASGVVGSYLGVPLTSTSGHVIGALCVFGPDPRPWSLHDVEVLSGLGRLAVRRLEARAEVEDDARDRIGWRLAVDAAGVGAFDWDLESRELRWDDRLIEIFGLDRTSFRASIEEFNAMLHPEDLPRVSEALQAAIDTCGDYAAEYRIHRRNDGALRWIFARGRTICDEAGKPVRLLGAAHDTTVERETEARIARILESMTTAFFQLDPSWRFTYVNAEAERVLGRSREELLGGVVWELFPAAVGSDFERFYRNAADTGQPASFDAYYPEPLNAWYEVRAWPNPDGVAVYFADITARRQGQEELARSAERSALLARVAEELSRTLDAEMAADRLAVSVTPGLADWAVVTLVDEQAGGDWRRRVRDVAWSHSLAEHRELLAEFVRVRTSSLPDQSLLARAVAGEGPLTNSGRTVEDAVRLFTTERARDLCRRLAPLSWAVTPLRGRDRVVGVLSVFRGEDQPAFTGYDLATLAEVGGRAGLALDNARLFKAQRDLAEGLQRSMLTAPVQADHLEVAVRYESAAEAARVGGDWYDAFMQRDGATVFVIGDVVGHDTEAAAAMGQLRSMLRGIAVHTGAGPAEVLSGVDRVMETLATGTTATAVVARLEADTEEATRLRWSTAGHPPPLVMHEDGSVAELAAGDSDLLLGLEPGTARRETVVSLERGATVLLYTDGLVERRGQSLDTGMARLRDVLTTIGPQVTLQRLCNRVLAAMLPIDREDDVALVAVRLHPQDQPRPPEAGPERLPDLMAPTGP